ncbi:MAG: RNA ligase family protein, partial [Thermoplasmata archaeon]
PYFKIPTVFKRDPATKHRTLLLGEYALLEFEYLKDNTWTFTEKVDGTNIRVMVGGDGNVEFGGKTDNAHLPARLVKRLGEMFFPLRERLAEQFPDGGGLYGEGYGAGIQKGGGNYHPTQEFVLFDVLVGDWWLERENVEDVADKLGLVIVPIVGEGSLESVVEFVREGFRSFWGDFPAEGIVARPNVTLHRRSGERIITKLKAKDFK